MNTSKSFYDKNERYTSDGLELDNEASIVISKIFKQWIEKGYKIREITGLIHSTVDSVGCFQILELNGKS